MYGRELIADAHELRAWLGKRKASLEAGRRDFERLWKDLRRHFEPNIGKALLTETERRGEIAKRDDDKLINEEPRLCVQRYAAGMQSGITNKAQSWLAIVPKTVDADDARDTDLVEWCDTATNEILASLERGNFYRVTQNVYMHGAVMGTACMMILAGDAGGDAHFQLIDEGDYWLAEDRFGRVATLLRRIPMTVAQARDEFMEAALPEAWRADLKAGRAEKETLVWNLVCPNEGGRLFADVPAERRYASFYWADGATGDEREGIIAVRSYGYKPFAVLRQSDSGAVYGKGIGEMSLGTAKELQQLELTELKLIAKEEDPPMLAPSSMKGMAINTYPGGVTFYDGLGGERAPVTRLYETREAIEAVDLKIQNTEAKLRKAWYNDLFSMMLTMNDRQKTATEVAELSGEKVALLGPVLTQMDAFLSDAVDAVLYLLGQDGVLPEAPALIQDGEAGLSVEYTSAIHAEMKSAMRMRSLNTLISMASMLAQVKPDVLDKIDADKIIDECARIHPGAAAFVRKDKEVAAIRQEREQRAMEQQRQMQLAELAKNAGQNAKALSETKTGTGNMLEQMLAG